MVGAETVPPAGKEIKSGTSDVAVKVTGSGFRAGMIARWRAADKTEPTELAPSAVKFESSTSATLTLTSGGSGAGTLLLLMPNGYTATAIVKVV
jgi:hypothetical protein